MELIFVSLAPTLFGIVGILIIIGFTVMIWKILKIVVFSKFAHHNNYNVYATPMPDNANSTDSLFDDSNYGSSSDVNPASGLPMVGDSMIDVSGNTYGSSGN